MKAMLCATHTAALDAHKKRQLRACSAQRRCIQQLDTHMIGILVVLDGNLEARIA